VLDGVRCWCKMGSQIVRVMTVVHVHMQLVVVVDARGPQPGMLLLGGVQVRVDL